MTGAYGPVADRATDLDHAEPEYNVRAHEIRDELRIAIERFVARFPVFEPAGDTRWSVGQIRGPRELPLRVLDGA